MQHLSLADARDLAEQTLIVAGAGPAMAASLARATVDAEARGQPALGFAHLVDYLDGLKTGRIDGRAVPKRQDPAPALITIDAGGGIAQTGFDLALDDFVARAKTFGIALFASSNAFTCGELGDYTLRLAEHRLVALAATNGPALITGSGGATPVYCTNPLSFAAPRMNGPPLLIDQSSSATAFVKVRDAADRGEGIPAGWAVDAKGKQTTDARAAMAGALIAFGGTRGANIALMVEILAAGLTGANWSLDAPDFASGTVSPGTGLTIIAIAPRLIDDGFEARLDRHLTRLSGTYGIYLPGVAKAAAQQAAQSSGIRLPDALFARISSYL